MHYERYVGVAHRSSQPCRACRFSCCQLTTLKWSPHRHAVVLLHCIRATRAEGRNKKAL